MEHRCLVYMVDDDVDVRDSMANSLEKVAGAEVRACASVDAFFRAYSSDSDPLCVLMDVRLGAASGLDALRKLRTRGDAVPVIMLTGHADVHLAVEAMRLGASDFLEKPVRPDELVATIERACRIREARKEIQETVEDLAYQKSLSRQEQRALRCWTGATVVCVDSMGADVSQSPGNGQGDHLDGASDGVRARRGGNGKGRRLRRTKRVNGAEAGEPAADSDGDDASKTLQVQQLIDSLPRRQRQTLNYLLLGDNEKQVAFKLRISRHTVHDYVKLLHQHFNVSSRGELLAKCLNAQRQIPSS